MWNKPHGSFKIEVELMIAYLRDQHYYSAVASGFADGLRLKLTEAEACPTGKAKRHNVL